MPETGSNGIASIEVYDPATNTWTTNSALPTASLGLASCTMNNKIYVAGGMKVLHGSSIAVVEEYSPDLD